MEIKITAELEVLVCEKATAFNSNEQQKTKDGQALFLVGYESEIEKKVGDKVLKTKTIETAKSLVELSPGFHKVELVQFHIADGKKVTTYNRIVKDLSSKKAA